MKQYMLQTNVLKLLFISIVLLAAVLRFTGLETLSPPLNRDEAGIGYNAYSLLKTGKDEHGVVWPLAFESIGDYKMPGYIYATILPVMTFGLNELAVRFWSAVAGVAAVAVLWTITHQLTSHYVSSHYKTWLAPATAFLLAINPWHIHYSRIGFEANLNLTLFLAGLLFFLQRLKNARWLIMAALFFVLMQYTYSSSFIFLPVFGLVLILFGIWQGCSLWKKQLKFVGIACGVFVIGSVLAVQGVMAVSQAKQNITVFSDPHIIDQFNHIRSQLNQTNPLLARTLYNKPFYMGRIVIGNYLATFSPNFLFFNGVRHPWHSVPGQGFFYVFDGIVFLIGLISIIMLSLAKDGKKMRGQTIVLVGWLLASPLASAITVDAPHATRSLYLIPVFLLVAGVGLVKIIEWLSSRLLFSSVIISGLVVTLYLISLIRFGFQYLAYYPKHYDPSLYSGIKPVIAYVNVRENAKPVYFTNVSSSPYLYVLFYGKIDPAIVQKTATWTPYDTAHLTHIEKIANYRFFHDIPVVNEKVRWVLQGEAVAPAGFSLEKEFRSARTGKIEWRVFSN